MQDFRHQFDFDDGFSNPPVVFYLVKLAIYAVQKGPVAAGIALTVGGAAFGGQGESLSTSPTVSLVFVWEASMRAQPRYEAGGLRIEAEDAEALALRRERLPEVSVEAGGDYGRRVRPGEERDQGVAGRGEILARVNWSLFESDRSARRRAIELRREGLVAADVAFDHAFRSEVARTYVHASIAAERRDLLVAGAEPVKRLADAVARRVTEGVDTAAARHRTADTLAAWKLRLREALDDAEAELLKLSLLADVDNVLPRRIEPIPPDIAATVDGNPAVAALRLGADERRAEAEALRRRDLWRLDAVGQAGPYFSRAFDVTAQQEYFGGLRFVWSPDMAGVRESRALAERRRARALEAEEAGLRHDLAVRVRETEKILSGAHRQAMDWRAALVRAEATERTARLRWEQGAGPWTEWLDALEHLTDVMMGELEWRARTALLLVDYAEAAGYIDSLPAWIDSI